MKNGLGFIFFSRRFGDVFKPFYIGETTSIRGRLRSHWRAANIKDVLRGIVNEEIVEIKGGERYFHFGYLIWKQSDPKRYLEIGQKYLIRFAIEKRCTLLNKNLTKIKSHELQFNGSRNGRAIFPKTGEIEARRQPGPGVV